MTKTVSYLKCKLVDFLMIYHHSKVMIVSVEEEVLYWTSKWVEWESEAVRGGGS
jgi:hypothetical protein